jgi:hypothetical protein
VLDASQYIGIDFPIEARLPTYHFEANMPVEKQRFDECFNTAFFLPSTTDS